MASRRVGGAGAGAGADRGGADRGDADVGATGAAPQLSPVDGLAQLSFLLYGTLERRAAEQGLSVIQTRLLGVLRDRRPTMNELARLLGLDKSSTTGLVDRAEGRGLVRRMSSAEDGRVVLVALTGTGRAVGARVASAFEQDVSDLLARLRPAERDGLAAVVSRLLSAHAAEHGIDLFPSPGPARRR